METNPELKNGSAKAKEPSNKDSKQDQLSEYEYVEVDETEVCTQDGIMCLVKIKRVI